VVVGVLAVSFVVGWVWLWFHPRSALLIHNSFLIIIGTVLITAGVSVIRRGLSPFAMLRERLQDVRSGRTSRLGGRVPDRGRAAGAGSQHAAARSARIVSRGRSRKRATWRMA
jgi:hypothetical protein